MRGETWLIGLHAGSLSAKATRITITVRISRLSVCTYLYLMGNYRHTWAIVIRLNVIAFASVNATLQPRSQGSLLPVGRRENLGTRLRNTATVLHAAQTRIAMIRACFHARNESLLVQLMASNCFVKVRCLCIFYFFIFSIVFLKFKAFFVRCVIFLDT